MYSKKTYEYSPYSPKDYKESDVKQNFNESQNSDYYRMKESVSTRQHTQQMKSSDKLYVVKLQSKILEMQKKLDSQKYQIDSMTIQTESLMNLCELQKRQLSNFNVEMLRQQYQEQIKQLAQEKQKISNLIYSISEQYKQSQLQQQAQLALIKKNNMELAQKIEKAMNAKELMLQQISNIDHQHLKNEEIILQQQQRIDQLRNIERKLFIAIKEMEAINKK